MVDSLTAIENLARTSFERLDQADPLAGFRDRFSVPAGVIYLDGNSLGAMPREAAERARRVVEREWADGLIRSWNEAGWHELPVRLGNKIGRLIGARNGEVVVTDSTSVGLYKVLSAALGLRPKRRVVVTAERGFPTNNYVTHGLLRQLGDDYTIRFAAVDRLAEAIDEDVAAVSLTQVDYRTGRLVDMEQISAAAHDRGALAIWDLCHSVGAFPIDVHRCRVDFAVGCTYKYLNGGPGSPAFVFVAERHQADAVQPLTGWWGHADPFAFERDFRPAEGIRRMLTGTPSVLSMAVAEAGTDVALSADLDLVRQKSMRMTELFIRLIEQRCAGFGLEVVSPRAAEERGSQVSVLHDDGYAIVQALIDRGVIGDYRAPGNMRFGMAPLYLRYADVWDAVEVLRSVLSDESWRNEKYAQRGNVT